MNVFGRNLNGIQKVTDRTGRDHYGNHSVMVMIGKNVKSSVIGGVVAADGTTAVYQAGDIDSATGAQVTGGDVAATKSQAAAVRTLGAALGIPDTRRGARLHRRRGRQGRHRRPREPPGLRQPVGPAPPRAARSSPPRSRTYRPRSRRAGFRRFGRRCPGNKKTPTRLRVPGLENSWRQRDPRAPPSQ